MIATQVTELILNVLLLGVVLYWATCRDVRCSESQERVKQLKSYRDFSRLIGDRRTTESMHGGVNQPRLDE